MDLIDRRKEVVPWALVTEDISKPDLRTKRPGQLDLNRSNFFVGNGLHTKMTELREEIVKSLTMEEMRGQKLRVRGPRDNTEYTDDKAGLITIMTDRVTRTAKAVGITGIATKGRTVTLVNRLKNLTDSNRTGKTTNELRHVKLIIFHFYTGMTKHDILIAKTSTHISLEETLEGINITEVIDGETTRNKLHHGLTSLDRRVRMMPGTTNNSIVIFTDFSLEVDNAIVTVINLNVTKGRNTNKRSHALLRRGKSRGEEVHLPVTLEEMIRCTVRAVFIGGTILVILRLTIDQERIILDVTIVSIVDLLIGTERQCRDTDVRIRT